jgi:hypothetical protein
MPGSVTELTVGVNRNSRHRVHVRLGNVFDDDGDIVIPPSDRLVVRSRQESSVVVDPGDGVDGSQVLIVLLRDLLLSQIVLNDLLVLHTSQEDVLLVLVRVEFHTVRNLSVRKGLNTLTCYGTA